MAHSVNERKRGPKPYPGPVTPAEQRVLDLVRQGLTNPEIAVRLGISRDAVKYHVSNMLSKLGLADRTELADWNGESPTFGDWRAGAVAGIPSWLAWLGPVFAKTASYGAIALGVGVFSVTVVLAAAVAHTRRADPATSVPTPTPDAVASTKPASAAQVVLAAATQTPSYIATATTPSGWRFVVDAARQDGDRLALTYHLEGPTGDEWPLQTRMSEAAVGVAGAGTTPAVVRVSGSLLGGSVFVSAPLPPGSPAVVTFGPAVRAVADPVALTLERSPDGAWEGSATVRGEFITARATTEGGFTSVEFVGPPGGTVRLGGAGSRFALTDDRSGRYALYHGGMRIPSVLDPSTESSRTYADFKGVPGDGVDQLTLTAAGYTYAESAPPLTLDTADITVAASPPSHTLTADESLERLFEVTLGLDEYVGPCLIAESQGRRGTCTDLRGGGGCTTTDASVYAWKTEGEPHGGWAVAQRDGDAWQVYSHEDLGVGELPKVGEPPLPPQTAPCP